ncbi:DUF3530 domain-containing protein [Idiomarina sp. OT37-5b]|uniref:DUF3530 family protein n=1 Tax=Idiomarina sp. OT37-5b TaxID=2100422 RepID=UPI000CF9F2C2|nr:DUF3530 family protein [Idiomarina sp. OT37-5b]AVJ56871.1 DUF3530 domain-containing protein [Idiomarina sp. OT37-5b]
MNTKSVIAVMATLWLSSTLVPPGADANDDLQRYLPPDQLRWLEHEDNRYLALYQPAQVNFVRGRLLSMPDWPLHPLQSPWVRHSYEQAPILGWHSWALVPPEMALQTHQLQQHNPASVHPQPVDEAFFEPYIAALQTRIQRLSTEFSDNPGFTLWVMEGITAAMAVKLIQQQPELMPDALVVIDMYLPQPQLNRSLSEQLAKLQLPVLELSTPEANQWVTSSLDLRRQYSQKHQQVNYRQRPLLSEGTSGQRELTSTLKGWLKYHGF